MRTVQNTRKANPLVHHITNDVVMNFTANGLLSFGASPIMASDPQEVAEITSLADGLLLNIGTLKEDELEAMVLAGRTANEKGIPVVLDPVGVAVSKFRGHAIDRLFSEISVQAIKGNAGEIAHLANVPWEMRGVDSADGELGELETIAKYVAKKFACIVILTGEIDLITDGTTMYQNDAGHEWLTKVTGAGCLLGSIVTACLAANSNAVEVAYEAVRFYGLSAERAASKETVSGPGSFAQAFLDELHR